MRLQNIKRKRQINNPPTKRGINRYVVVGMFVVFIFVSVFITIQGVTAGNELTYLEDEARVISKENKKLSEKLIENSSLFSKAEAAEEYGFYKPSNIVYLDGEVSVASLR